MFRLTYILFMIIVLIIGTIFVYKIYYTHKINKKIQSGEITGKKLVDVSKMVMIAVITGLVIYAGILMYIVDDYATRDISVPRNNYAVIDIADENAYEYISYFGNVELIDASYAKVYNKDENVGYNKEIVESGDYRFTVFTRNSESDDFHPDFLCFVDYTGGDMEEYMCYSKAGFQSIDAKGDQFYGESSGYIKSDLLYIGNLDKGCQFNITMSLLNEDGEIKYDEAMQQAYKEDKGEFPDSEEYAVKVGKVSIIIK